MAEFLRLKKSNCRNCYKCIRHCPVKAIRFTADQAHIVYDECILCGQCFVVCPQNAKEIADESDAVREMLSGDAPVYLSIAPSFAAYFEGSGISDIEKAVKQLGFAGCEETALGAALVKREYDRLLKEHKTDILISSCCRTADLLIEKYYPEVLPYLAPVMTPMEAHCRDLKKRYKNAVTVFAGPCLSKMDEADKRGVVDAVLTFEDLSAMLRDASVNVGRNRDVTEKSRTRLFPTAGGIIKSMNCDAREYTYMEIDGLENCKAVLNDIKAGGLKNCFIEMSACSGSCIGGPVMKKYHDSPVRHYTDVVTYAGKDDFDIPQPDIKELAAVYERSDIKKPDFSDSEIDEMLRAMGKKTPEDELNCGACGYDSCRDKAYAILSGKAEIDMCLPRLIERSERFSNNIIENSPNGIIVLNDMLEIQQMNRAACEMFSVSSSEKMKGEQINRLIDAVAFIDVLDGGTVKEKLEYYAKYDKYIRLTVVSDRVSNMMIALLRDVTAQCKEQKKRDEIRAKTIETADRVTDDQMRIVQEIASLLGKTAAETKSALESLKMSAADPEDEDE